jgi:hypothetical protein
VTTVRPDRPYIAIFIDDNGPGPWPCYVCGESVVDLLVHHLDEDRTNNAPENLVAVHRSCHATLHMGGKPKSEEHRAKLSAAGLGRTFSDESRAKMSESAKNRRSRT